MSMEHLFLLRDIYDLLNSYDLDHLPNSTKEQLRAMRNRIDAYVVSQGYEIGYIGYAPDEEVVLYRDGVAVPENHEQLDAYVTKYPGWPVITEPARQTACVLCGSPFVVATPDGPKCRSCADGL